MEYALFSEKGLRDENADYAVIDPEKNIFITADGVGSNFFAKHASKRACETAYKECKTTKIKKSVETIISAIDEANQAVQREYLGSATTLDLVLIKNSKAYIGHVGDSRVYLLRRKKLIQLTQDHIQVKNKLNRAVGTDFSAPDIIHPPGLRRGDIIAMTTDGVHNILSREEMTDILKIGMSLENTADLLKISVQYNGAFDNYTGILIRV